MKTRQFEFVVAKGILYKNLIDKKRKIQKGNLGKIIQCICIPLLPLCKNCASPDFEQSSQTLLKALG